MLGFLLYQTSYDVHYSIDCILSVLRVCIYLFVDYFGNEGIMCGNWFLLCLFSHPVFDGTIQIEVEFRWFYALFLAKI